jgi:uncharacterized protein YndB with AHSA1/START domain
METTDDIIPSSPDREMVATRIIHAVRERVYKAWTDPAHLKNWWGPRGFSNTFHEFDFWPGGRWSFIMHGPDNDNYPNECVFVKIEKPELIVWNHLSSPKFQVVVSLDEVAHDKTRVTFKMVFDTAKECAKIKAFAGDKNEENLDKLEVELLEMEN